MNKMKLCDFAQINPPVKLEKGKKYPCVMMDEITPGRRYVFGENKRAYTGGSRFQKGDVLFARITPCLENGKIAQFLGDGVGFGSTEYFIFRQKDGVSDQSYIYYLANSEIVRKPAEKSMFGASGRQRADLTVVMNIEVPAPPLPIQRRIADILSAYDDMIENNIRRIRILEQMAQVIYQECFGKVDKKSLPVGWEFKKLGDVIELAYGKGLKADQRIDGDYPVYGSAGIVGYHNEYLVEGPGIIVGRKGNVGSVFWSKKNFFPIDTTYFVQTDISLYYTFFNLQTQHFINNDAAVPGLNRNQAYSLPFLVPAKTALDRFDSFVAPIFEQLEILNAENVNLRQTRDLLLPRLVSGEIDVSSLS